MGLCSRRMLVIGSIRCVSLEEVLLSSCYLLKGPFDFSPSKSSRRSSLLAVCMRSDHCKSDVMGSDTL